MKLSYHALFSTITFASRLTIAAETELYACRDYLRVIEYFPNGTSCRAGNLPSQESLMAMNDGSIESNAAITSTQKFLEQHCCAFGGGDKISINDPVFQQLHKFTGKTLSDFQDQYSPSQQALFWIAKEDSFENLAGYLRIKQRFALASLYFGLNGDSNWMECSRNHVETTSCSVVQENKTNWMSANQECEWAYISCDRDSFVIELNMSKYIYISMINQLYLSYSSPNYNILAGNIAYSLEKVAVMSPDVALLSESLERLILKNNQIGGMIPSSIGSLNLLTVFDVGYNRLQGVLPHELLTNATGLEIIRVGHNLLTGTIPELRLSQLLEINLNFNDFTGNISNVFDAAPKLGKLHELQGVVVKCISL